MSVVPFRPRHPKPPKAAPQFCPACAARDALARLKEIADAVDRALVTADHPQPQQLADWLRDLQFAEQHLAMALPYVLVNIAADSEIQ